MSAKSEELEGLRDGEPVEGEAAAFAVHGDGRVNGGDTGSAIEDVVENVSERASGEADGEGGKADRTEAARTEADKAGADKANADKVDADKANADKAETAQQAETAHQAETVHQAEKAKDGESDALAETVSLPEAAHKPADALSETVSLPRAAHEPADALAETVSLNTVADHDHMRVRPPGPVAKQSAKPAESLPADSLHADSLHVDSLPADAVAQDVAEETARVLAEASQDDAAAGADAVPGQGGAAKAGDGVGAEPDEAPFPARRERHTLLYGRGIRVLPWKHKSRLAPRQRRRRKVVVASLWGCVLVFFGTLGWSVAGALTSPGTDTVQARLAEWGRDHGLGSVVATLEQWQYDLNPPSKGGAVDARQFTDLGPTSGPPSSATPSKNGAPSKPGAPSSSAADLIAMAPRMPAPPGLTLESGEGVFQVAVQTRSGQPVVQIARIRPDAVYTDVAADIVVIDQKHSSYVLHPGHEGGLNSIITNVPNQIDAGARPNLIALFNGGFKISESHGGYYDHGVTAAPLVDGAASEVIFKDGHMAVGMWGRDYSFAKNADIVSVRQNLKLMVDGGQVVPYIDDSTTWGRADHGSAAVWRSGVGVKANGDIVWVGGNKLTAPSLGRLLKDAGAVRGMQLDINLRWADFQYFPNHDGDPNNSKLYEDFLQGPNKFFVNSTKDFMAVYLR